MEIRRTLAKRLQASTRVTKTVAVRLPLHWVLGVSGWKFMVAKSVSVGDGLATPRKLPRLKDVFLALLCATIPSWYVILHVQLPLS